MKMVLVVRSDLSMSPGKMAAQVAHAAVQCAALAKGKNRRWFAKWGKEGGKKVVVRAADLPELIQLRHKAERLGLPLAQIIDAGLTELPPGTVTCLGIGPGPDETIDEVTGRLELYV